MPRFDRSRHARKKIGHHESSATHRPDLVLLSLVVGLTIFGLIMIYNVSAYEGFQEFNDKLFFVKQQLTWVVLGTIGGLVGYKINYRALAKLSPFFLTCAIILLVAVLLPGVGTRILGAKRWINIADFLPFLPGATLQPAELAKPAMALYFASWLTSKKEANPFQKMISFGLVVGIVAGLIMLEPDLGTTIVIVSVSAGLYFLAGAPIMQMLAMIPIGFAALAVLIIAEPYRMQRLVTFLNPQNDPQGSSYHIMQILLTLGSGGLTGVGLGNSGQKYGYLPEATTDSIFAVIGGELGFLGAIALIAGFIWFVTRASKVAQKAPDQYSQLLAWGITIWIGMQAIVNIGSNVALFPLTGVPLPFVSYGGSSLITLMFGVGLLLNISKYTKE